MNNSCCFFGHRKIILTGMLRQKLTNIIEKLIVEEKIDTFLFGSKSQFDDLCYEIVSKSKEVYPHIKRVYVRAEFPYINDDYRLFLLNKYEDTYYPDNVLGAGKTAYVKRNREMINNSEFCVVYYDENYSPPVRKTSGGSIVNNSPKSGTMLAYNYALKKQKKIINVFCLE